MGGGTVTAQRFELTDLLGPLWDTQAGTGPAIAAAFLSQPRGQGAAGWGASWTGGPPWPGKAPLRRALHALSVTALEQILGSCLEAVGAEHFEAEGVAEPVGRVERDADRQRVLDLLA
jgi:hypothetical protein